MKKKLYKFNIYGLLLIATTICFLFHACEKEDITMDPPRTFRPAVFTATVVDASVIFNWVAIPGVDSYTIEVSRDSLEFVNIIDKYVIGQTSYTLMDLLTGQLYSARVRANSLDMEHDSKYNVITFRIPPENIFKDYDSYMSGTGKMMLKWAAGKTVTHLTLTASGNVDTYPITTTDAENGAVYISDLDAGVYTVDIFNNDIKRGTVTVTIGNRFVDVGDDLGTVLSGAQSGDVIVLANDGSFILSAYTIPQNISISIVGANTNKKSTLYSDQSGVSVTLSDFSNVHFENLNIDGAIGGTSRQYFINHGSAVNFGTISFENCVINDFTRSFVRINHASARIERVKINNCIISGNTDAGYCIVQANTAGSIINNVEITDATIFNMQGGLYYNAGGQAFNMFLLRNCTLYDVFSNQNGCFLRVNPIAGMPATSTIQNVILGKLKLNDATVRLFNTVENDFPTVSNNNYSTSQATDGDCRVRPEYSMGINSYSGNSNDLFVNPGNADFHINDLGFSGKGIAGDPRWF